MKATSDKYRAGYETGEMVWLDGDLCNRSRVKVVRQPPQNYILLSKRKEYNGT